MPRPLGEQVVVLTGASSGIGREAATLLGRRGASLVLAARDEAALREVAGDVEREGGRVHVVPTDVADWTQVQRLAQEAVDRFGRIDTWINDAGIAIGGTVEDHEIEEIERIVRVNLLGQIFGVKAAIPHMRKQGGGNFICLGSVAAVRSFPLQTIYSATKHGVKALCEGLRLELQREPGEWHVTMIAPPAINTPLFEQARSKLGTDLGPPRPIFDPGIVAESIVFAAEHPRRDIFIGAAGKMIDLMQRLSPAMVDWSLARNDKVFKEQITDRPDGGPDNLFQPPPGPRRVHGSYGGAASSTSLYTKAFEWHPALKPIALAAVSLGAVAMLRKLSRSSPRRGFRPVEAARRSAEAIL